jgi:hypothetical protein
MSFNPIYKRKAGLLLFLALATVTSCKKFVDVNTPYTSLNSANVYTSDATAIAAVTGIYANLSIAGGISGGLTSLSYFGGLSADELTLYSGAKDMDATEYYTNALNARDFNSGNTDSFWNSIYPVIYSCNAALAGLNNSVSLTAAIKQQLTGETKFIRALCYFYLTNLYGDVPLVTGIDYKVNGSLARTPKAQIYNQVIADLKDAQSLLSKNYLDNTLLANSTERERPTYWAAAALLARVYLYNQDPKDAEMQAAALTSNNSLFSLSTLNNAFLKASLGNNEAIWQLQPVTTGQNTWEGVTFIIPSTGLSHSFPVYLNNSLLASFEPGDGRRTNWIDSTVIGSDIYYYPYKYKAGYDPGVTSASAMTEYEMVLRLGEQYLIHAEAASDLGDQGTAVTDLNAIRNRAGLGNYAGATDPASVQAAILHERRVELFTEWGHRWLDLKRSGTMNTVMGAPGNACLAKGGVWNANDALYPIPQSEIQYDPNLKQNPGY